MPGDRSRTTTFGGNLSDALVCISHCDEVTPGMLRAAMRLNIPTIFVSGGPMEAGKRAVSKALRADARMTTRAARGAVRDLDRLVERHRTGSDARAGSPAWPASPSESASISA